LHEPFITGLALTLIVKYFILAFFVVTGCKGPQAMAPLRVGMSYNEVIKAIGKPIFYEDWGGLHKTSMVYRYRPFPFIKFWNCRVTFIDSSLVEYETVRHKMFAIRADLKVYKPR
jgi:hypothetical protein